MSMKLKLNFLLIIQILHQKNHDYVNNTPEEQISNIKAELVALKSFEIEQIYVLKKRLEGKEVSPEGNDFLKLLPDEILTSEKKTK